MPEKLKIRKGIWYALIFSIISLYFIFQSVNKISLKENFSRINWLYIGFGFLALFLVWLAKAYRMYAIGVGMGVQIKLSYYYQLYLATCFISHITPFNSGGTPLQIYLLHKKGITIGRATAITAVDLGLNTAMFLLLIPVAVLSNIHLLKNRNPSIKFSVLSPFLVVIVFGLILVFLLRLPGVWPRIKKWRWVSKIRSYLRLKGWRKHLQHEWELFKEGWVLLVHQNPRSIAWAILATFIYWFFYLLLAPIIFWAIGKQISFLSLMGWQLLFNFLQIFIPTPGGSGGSELILLYLFKNLTGAARVGTFVLLWKVYTFFSTLIIGGFYFWKLTNKND